MEAQLIAWCQDLFHGAPAPEEKDFPVRSPGLITDGGTRSISEALRAYIRYAKEVLGIQNPEIIVPSSVHVAFDNAANYMGAKLIKVPVDPITGKADVAAMEKKITKSTCLLVGSAPSFPSGVFDDIPALGGIAERHQLPLHVDACLGGFYNAFIPEEIPQWDFSVKGVTSISADLHKYGEAPKGSSVILWKTANCKATSAFGMFDWKGGHYVTPGMTGSRRGDAVATAWAILSLFGKERFQEITKNLSGLKKALVQSIERQTEQALPYPTPFPMLTIDVIEGTNSHVVASEMSKKGWEVNVLQPTGFHFCLTAAHLSVENFQKDFVSDLSAAIEHSRLNPKAKPEGMAKLYGKLPDLFGLSIGDLPRALQQKIADIYTAIRTTLPKFADSKGEQGIEEVYLSPRP